MCWPLDSFRKYGSLLAFSLLSGAHISSASEIGLSQSTYTAKAGDVLVVVVSFDESVPNGLEGYALMLSFPQNLLSVSGIEIVPELDWGLFDAGAELDAGDSFASAAGFVEFGEPAYNGTSFVTFNLLVTAAAVPGTYSLQLAPLLDQGTNFVNGNGDAIDDTLTFGSAVLEIIEPSPEEYLGDLRIDFVASDVLLRFTGTAGRSYKIQYSSSLTATSWQDLATVVAPSDGVVELLDDSVSLSETRFYRVVQP